MRLNRKQVETAVPLLLDHKKQDDIAKTIGVSQGTVSNLKAKLKPYLEKMQMDLVFQAGEPTVENTILTIQRANRVLSDEGISDIDIKEYKDLLDLSHKKEMILHDLTGNRPTHTAAPVFQLINKVSVSVLEPEALAFADAKVIDLVGVQDAEYQETEPSNDGGSQ